MKFNSLDRALPTAQQSQFYGFLMAAISHDGRVSILGIISK